MINPSKLNDLLQKAIDNNIETIFIHTLSGGILCMKGEKVHQTILDILPSMWIEYYQVEETSLSNEKLNYLLVENENLNILSSNLYGYLITVIAKKTMKLGMLKFHLENIVNVLNDIFKPYKDVISAKNN